MEDAHLRELKKAEQQIQLQNNKPNKEDVGQDKSKNNEKKLGARVRPATPTQRVEPDGRIVDVKEVKKDENKKDDTYQARERIADQRNKAVLLLQRLIRGRYTQNYMYEGKEKRMALIDELLAVAKIENLPEAEKEKILLEDHQEKVKNALLEAI